MQGTGKVNWREVLHCTTKRVPVNLLKVGCSKFASWRAGSEDKNLLGVFTNTKFIWAGGEGVGKKAHFRPAGANRFQAGQYCIFMFRASINNCVKWPLSTLKIWRAFGRNYSESRFSKIGDHTKVSSHQNELSIGGESEIDNGKNNRKSVFTTKRILRESILKNHP